MDEILHHLGWLKPYIYNGIIIILGGAGFCPSTVLKIFRWRVPSNLVLVAEAEVEQEPDDGHRSVTGWDSSVQRWGHLSTGWWFQIFLYFHSYLGKIPILTHIFSNGVEPPTSQTIFWRKPWADSKEWWIIHIILERSWHSGWSNKHPLTLVNIYDIMLFVNLQPQISVTACLGVWVFIR